MPFILKNQSLIGQITIKIKFQKLSLVNIYEINKNWKNIRINKRKYRNDLKFWFICKYFKYFWWIYYNQGSNFWWKVFEWVKIVFWNRFADVVLVQIIIFSWQDCHSGEQQCNNGKTPLFDQNSGFLLKLGQLKFKPSKFHLIDFQWPQI